MRRIRRVPIRALCCSVADLVEGLAKDEGSPLIVPDEEERLLQAFARLNGKVREANLDFLRTRFTD